MLKTCPQCDSEFKTYFRKARFCSKACHSASMIRRDSYICSGCGLTFTRPKHVIKKAAVERFCSPACHQQHRMAVALIRECRQCGTSFRPGKAAIHFCSAACKYAAQVTALQKTCAQCGTAFRAFASADRRGRRFCSHTCATKWNSGERHANYKGGVFPPDSKKWRHIRQRIIARDRRCRLCGVTKSPSGRNLSVHHINARRSYLLSEMANLDKNLVALCHPCHTRVEMAITHGRTSSLPRWLRPRA